MKAVVPSLALQACELRWTPTSLKRERRITSTARLRPVLGEVGPQFADGLVLLVADALWRQAQLLGRVLHGPTLEAQLQDALLSRRQHLGRRLPHRLALLTQLPGVPVLGVGHAVKAGRPLAGALAALLDRVDGPQELAVFLAVGVQGAVPAVRRHAL